MIESFDAIIIGGGPAGGFASLRLAQSGWKVLLAEGASRSRAKSCGHCLNPRVAGILARAGLLADAHRIKRGSTRWLRVHIHGRGAPLTAQMPPGLIVERARFDQVILDRAASHGAAIVHEARAQLTGRGDSGIVQLRTPAGRRLFHAPLVIGADGLRSSVADAAGLTARRVGRKYGFSFDMTTSHAPTLERDVVHMFVAAGGYLGVVNQGGGVLHAAGLVSPRRGARQSPLGFVHELSQKFPPLLQAGFGIAARATVKSFAAAGPMPCRPRAVSSPHVALVGDAAGYVEPFTGEGMSWAIESADALAEVLEREPAGSWDPGLARRYARAWQSRIGRRQRFCSIVACLLERPRLLRALLSFDLGASAMAERMIRPVVTA
jgi:flavin-dependent dehydrogenase